MAFPDTPLALRLEFELGGAFVDVAADSKIRGTSEVTVQRGRADWAADPDPGQANFLVDNRDGELIPDNPMSPWYGDLRLNTMARASIDQGARYLWVINEDAPTATTPDVAALDITGDMAVAIDFTAADHRSSYNLISKYATVSDQRSWAFFFFDGVPYFRWSTAGTAASVLERAAQLDGVDLPVEVPVSGRMAVATTIDVNVGGTSHTVTFYTAPTIAGPWVQHGDPRTFSGTTSIFASTATLTIGEEEITDVLGEAINGIPGGRVHKASVASGLVIGASEAANPDFTIQTAGASSFADAAGRTWTIGAGGQISQRRWRFCQELWSLPTESDASGADVYSPAESAGVLRRIKAGTKPIDSPYYRHNVTAVDNLVQYWPCEELAASKSRLGRFASAVGGPSLFVSQAEPNPGVDETFACSKALPQLNLDQWLGSIGHYVHSDQVQWRWLMLIDEAGSVNGQTIIEIETTGPVYRVRYETGGTLRLEILNSEGTTIQDNTGLFSAGLNGVPVLMSLELIQDGADVDWALRLVRATTGVASNHSGTITGRKVRRAERVIVSPAGGIDDIVIGHITFQRQVDPLNANADYWFGVLKAWEGETAGQRVKRLCEDAQLPFRAVGDLDDSLPMGPQPVASLYEAIAECARTDQGILYEPADVCGLGYRTRVSMGAQEPIELDYTLHLSGSFRPTYDASRVRNDVLVNDRSGAFARQYLSDGLLSINEPTQGGIGRYDHQVDVNAMSTMMLEQIAAWILSLGTQPLTRYPEVTVELHRAPLVADQALTTRLLEARPGDRLLITNLPAGHVDDEVSVLIEHVEDVMSNKLHTLKFTLTPEEPYHVGVFDGEDWVRTGEEPRYDTDSELTSAITSSATSISVTTTNDLPWVDSATFPAEFPFKVRCGGEVMTVTAITGTTSPQTFTVTRSVNGVVKAHAAGAPLSLAYPAYYEL